MNTDEYRRHAHAEELLKIISHITTGKAEILKAIPRIKRFGQHSEMGQAIETNIDALCNGIVETVALCAALREAIKKEMTEPNASPLHKLGSLRHYVTPFQRMLEHQGVKLPMTNPTRYMPDVEKRQKKMIRLIPDEERVIRHELNKRRRNKYTPPL